MGRWNGIKGGCSHGWINVNDGNRPKQRVFCGHTYVENPYSVQYDRVEYSKWNNGTPYAHCRSMNSSTNGSPSSLPVSR